MNERLNDKLTSMVGITLDAALARFALIFRQKTPEDAANYIAVHYDDLALYLEKKSMLSLQIDLLSQSGQSDKANDILDTLIEDGLSEAEENRFRRIIAEAEGTDSVNILKVQFKETDSLIELTNLVHELEARDDWDGLCEYGKILFEKTHNLRHAEALALALYNTQKKRTTCKVSEIK